MADQNSDKQPQPPRLEEEEDDCMDANEGCPVNAADVKAPESQEPVNVSPDESSDSSDSSESPDSPQNQSNLDDFSSSDSSIDLSEAQPDGYVQSPEVFAETQVQHITYIPSELAAEAPVFPDLSLLSGSESVVYEYLCEKTGRFLVASGSINRADIPEDEELLDASEAAAEETAEDATPQVNAETSESEKLWCRLSHLFLSLHARTWFGDEERDRLAVNEYYRRITRYVIVDIVVLVSWVVAELIEQRQHISELMFTSLVYTLMFMGSATMLILSYIHLYPNTSNVLGEPTTLRRYLARNSSSAELRTRCEATIANAAGCETGHHWKILYLRATNAIFGQWYLLQDVSYSITSSKRLYVICAILEDLRIIANASHEAPPAMASAYGAPQNRPEHVSTGSGDSGEQRPKEKTSEAGNDSNANMTGVSSDQRESKLLEETNSILQSLLSKVSDEKSSTENDRCSAASVSQDEKISSQDPFGAKIRQRLTTWLNVIRRYFRESAPQTERSEETKQSPENKAGNSTRTRYSCIRVPRKEPDEAESLSESSEISGIRSETLPEDRISSSDTSSRKRPADSPEDTGSPSKQSRLTKGKMSRSLRYRYTKGSKSEIENKISKESSSPSRRSQDLLGKRSRSPGEEGPVEESTLSAEPSTSGLQELVKRSRLQSSTEHSSSEDAGSPIQYPFGESTTEEPERESSDRPEAENEIVTIFRIPDGDYEYIIRRVPASFQCEEIDPPPEIELLLTVLNFLDNLGLTIRSALFKRHFGDMVGFDNDSKVIRETMFRQCYEILKSSIRDKGIPCLRILKETLQKVLENLDEVPETLASSLAILTELGKTDDKDELGDLY